MAERIEIKTITVPAGTAIATPQSTALTWREGHPERIEIRIPPGPSGLLGVALAHSGRKIIPRDPNEWLVTDAEPVIWPLEGYSYTAKWTVLAYNLDSFQHEFQVRMLLREVRLTGNGVPPPIEVEPPNEPAEPPPADYIPGEDEIEPLDMSELESGQP